MHGLAGATGKTIGTKGKIIDFAWKLKKDGYTDGTIRTYSQYLSLLLRAGANLIEPETVKEALVRQRWSDNSKFLAVAAYSAFASFAGLNWKPPRYKCTYKIPFVPTEEEIDQLIAASGKKLSAFLGLLKETGMRCGEALRLEWAGVDFRRKTVGITAEKGSYPRILPISGDLVNMLSRLSKESLRIFPGSMSAMKSNLHRSRRRLATKMNNPRLLKISFHSLRHWKGTMEYHKTRDILHVKELLGHRNIQNTLLYINIEKGLFAVSSDEFHVKVAKTPKQIKGLLEVGFEYVCEKKGLLFFRKRK